MSVAARRDNRRRCAIAVMAKAPQAGRSKTRLCPPLLAEEAAALGGAFLRDITATVRRAGRLAAIDGYVAYAPAGGARAIRPYLARGTRLVLADGSAGGAAGVRGFGRALLHAMRALFARGYASVCLLNADSPTLPARLLTQAAARLRRGRAQVVIGAASDGGYYLIGARAPHPSLFADIAWSTDAVCAQTLRQARRGGLRVLALPGWYDVDDAGSLARAVGDLADHRAAAGAPATAAAFARLKLQQRLEGRQ